MTSDQRVPAVTVVVPTAGRRTELRNAVESALAQRDVDVVVHVVGDRVSAGELSALLGPPSCDRRVVVASLPIGREGSNAARNFGVENARSEWIAFLDDDDEWFPDKLAKQFAAIPPNETHVVMSHKFVARTRERDYVWPRYAPQDARHLSEYLFCRRGAFDGDGHLQTSTILTRRSLVLEHPLREDLRRHQDHDWVLRCTYEGGARIVMLGDVLSVYNVPEPGQGSIGGRGCWQERWQWASENRHLFTKRGYAGFLTSYGVFAAAADGDRRGIVFLVREAFRNGKPRGRDLLVAGALATIPASTRRRIRARVAR